MDLWPVPSGVLDENFLQRQLVEDNDGIQMALLITYWELVCLNCLGTRSEDSYLLRKSFIS